MKTITIHLALFGIYAVSGAGCSVSVSADRREAFRLNPAQRCILRVASSGGNVDASRRLAQHELIWNSKPEASVKFFRKAAEQGDLDSMIQLAQNEIAWSASSKVDDAITWLDKAKQLGSSRAAKLEHSAINIRRSFSEN